jgi:signal transduction histidine kinase/CheY-like chemotaxis protein
MKKPIDERASDARREAERRLAERRLAERTSGEKSVAPASAADAAALVHELEVHQIELEMQNEELRVAHAEAEAARARFADLFDFAPVGYFTVSRDSSIREVNLTGARLLGVERAKLIGCRLGVFLAESDRRAFSAALSAAHESRGPQECEATLTPAPNGSSPATLVQMTISVPLGGEEARVAVFDSTERRRSENLARTSQKLEAIGLLAGGVAHDFNNLLTIIMSNCALALETVAGEAPLHEPLVELREAAERAAGLTRQLLAFSRKQVVVPRVVDLNSLVRHAGGMLRRIIPEDIELVLTLAPDLGPVELDPTQFDQMFLNLVINARDAMPGGGRLTVSTTNVGGDPGGAPQSPSARSGSRVRLTVSDTGTGMDAQTMEHIFEPFFTTKELGRGTGLGLSTVFGIVTGCGGHISVRSRPGEGATFDVDLPRAPGPPLNAEPRRESDPAAKGTETILVVDDEPVLLRIALRVLTSAGYTVLGATSGNEALALSERHEGKIHLLLSDIIMPGMSGSALGQRLREIRPETKILYMSGHTADALKSSNALGDRPVELLDKPFTPEELRRKVREVLGAP